MAGAGRAGGRSGVWCLFMVHALIMSGPNGKFDLIT